MELQIVGCLEDRRRHGAMTTFFFAARCWNFSFPLRHGISRYLEGLFSAERRGARPKVESHRLNLVGDSRRDMKQNDNDESRLAKRDSVVAGLTCRHDAGNMPAQKRASEAGSRLRRKGLRI